MTEKRPLTATDLYNFKIIGDPKISPDGNQIIFTLQHVDRATEAKHLNLWMVAGDGGQPRQFTQGDCVDSQPRWSPDSGAIAFLSNRSDKKQTQLYIIPRDGGEARQLTQMQGQFGNFAWSPDGKRIVAQFRQKDAEAIAREQDPQKEKLGIVARHITRLNYKLDGAGYLPQERWHIWTIDAVSGQATQLTSGTKHDETQPCWSPDGQSILFISNRADDPDLEPDETELYLIPADGGQMAQVTTGHNGRKLLASFSPDGNQIAYLGRAYKQRMYQNACLYVVPTSGGQAQNLSAAHDLHLSVASLTDVGSDTPQRPPIWAPDGQQIIVQAAERGNQPLCSFGLDGSLTRIIDGAGGVGAFSVDVAQQKIAYLWGSSHLPGQIWLGELAHGISRPLTSFNTDWLRGIAFGEIEEVSFAGADGYDLQGWILKPPGFDPSQQYPSILEIHGGPMAQYGRFFMHEFHYLAAQGYVVYWSNPRGSQGYGEAHAGAIHNNWGTVDYTDMMAWADHLAQQPYIDTQRMGVTGGSYGGYMTVMIIGRTQRFKAAVAQRVVSNFISFYGSSDMNWATEALVGTQTPWTTLENYWRQSPISTIGNARTPTLIIHSETDLRCHQEQGEQVFVALKRMGVETEMLLLPEESHGLSRNGRTDRRVARLTHILRWFDKHLSPSVPPQ